MPGKWYFLLSRLEAYSPRMKQYATERAHNRIAALPGEGLDLVNFWREVNEVIGPLIPQYMGLCWYTLDPASLLVTSHFNDNMPELPPEWLALEYYDRPYELSHILAALTHSGATMITKPAVGIATNKGQMK